MRAYCEQCGREFQTSPALLKRGNRFCSCDCFNNYRRSQVQSRFWSKVRVGDPEQCWKWMGAMTSAGYGCFGAADKKLVQAHRYAYEISIGPIPVGFLVRHRCHNRACCNPSHLATGTHKDNSDDKLAANRQDSKFSERDVCVIRHQHSTGQYTFGELAEQMNVCIGTIRNIVSRKTWSHLQQPADLPLLGQNRKPGHGKGSKHPRSMLTEDQVREMRREYSSGGVLQKDLALRYGISSAAVSAVIRKKHWTHVA